MKQYNVLHLVPSRTLGGAERMVQLIGRYLNRERFNQIIVCPEGPLKTIYEQEGHRLIAEDIGFPYPGTILRLRMLIKHLNIHLLHAHDHRASLLAWLCAWPHKRLPVISHLHSANPWMKGRHPHKVLEMLMRRRYDLTIACCENVREYFLKHNAWSRPERMITIANGIEIKTHPPVDREGLLTRLGIPGGCRIVGAVGRLEPLKGIDLLLKAFKKVALYYPFAVLLIVGTGSQELALKSLAGELGLENEVFFTGYREDVHDLFQLMDVFALASRWEGLPMVLLESMSHSLPVVAADVGGTAEAVQPGKTGFLVRSGDVDDLADKLLRLCLDKELSVRMGLAGYSLVKDRFDIVKQSARIEGLYESLLAG